MPNARSEWPFLALADEAGRGNGWCILSGPLRKLPDLETYHKLRRSFRFLGFASYLTFPAVEEGVLTDYGSLCEGWCHGFRNPDLYISAETPKVLISESDFVDYHAVAPEALCPSGELTGKDFDFIYICLPGRWKEMTKNWPLAKICLHRLCGEMNLKGLLLGRWQILDLPFTRNLTIKGDVPREDLLRYLHRSRFLFIPGIMDASPRVLTEALAMNIPVLVHRQILGGWKYVNENTGAFFDSEENVAQGALECLSGGRQPRRWFAANYGPVNSSRRLSAFLQRLDPAFEITPSLRIKRELLLEV